MESKAETMPVTREEFRFCIELALLKAVWSHNALFTELTVDLGVVYQINPDLQPLLDSVAEECGLDKKNAWTIEEMKGLFDRAESLIPK